MGLRGDDKPIGTKFKDNKIIANKGRIFLFRNDATPRGKEDEFKNNKVFYRARETISIENLSRSLSETEYYTEAVDSWNCHRLRLKPLKPEEAGQCTQLTRLKT